MTEYEKLPFVVFAGVGKCGTSWLYEYLANEHEVRCPKIKEPYILNAKRSDRGKLIEELYEPGGGALLDFSNTYFNDTSTDEALSHFVNPRVVLTVREPSERAYSHYRYILSNGRTGEETFASYIDSGDPNGVVDRSDYEPVVRRYQELVGRESVLVLPLEQLSEEPATYLNSLHSFLGLSTAPRLEAAEMKVRPARQSRSGLAARAAKTAAIKLRSRGYLTLLGTLKKSKTLDHVLFSQAPRTDSSTNLTRGASPKLDELSDSYADFLARYV